MSPSRLRVLALASAALSAGCSARAEGASSREATLSNAIADDGDPAVVALVYAADPTQLRCTGTLIDERVVLTAAHCTARVDPEGLRVFAGSELGAASGGTAILEAVAHPDADDSADHDLALLLLAEPLPIAPIPLSREAPVVGTVRLVGFGLTAAGAGDDDRKREGTGRIREVTPLHVVLEGDPSLPCSGDSGGPVLATSADGEVLAAVVSRGDAECSDASRATRVDAHVETFVAPWLDAWAEGSVASGAPCLYDAHCERGLCAAALDEPSLRFCGGACGVDGDCDAALVCQEGVCRHPLPSPGTTGAACTAHGDCVRGDCLDEEGICSVRCVSGRDDCPAGFECAHLGGVDFYCVPPPPSAGCSAGGRASAAPLGALLLFLCARRKCSKFRN